MHSVSSSRSKLRSVILFAGLFSAITMTGCQPSAEARSETEPAAQDPGSFEPIAQVPVAGQVFLVMPTGESLRLGSVELQIFEKEAMAAHFAEREQELLEIRDEMERKLAQLQLLAREAEEARVRAEASLDERKQELQDELTAFYEELEAQSETFRETIRSNADFINSVEAIPMLPPGIPTPEEFAVYEEKRQQWLSMTYSERAAWAEVLIGMNENIEAELENMDERREAKLTAVEEERQQLEVSIDEAVKQAELAAAAVVDFREELAAFPAPAAYLENLPPPLLKGRTDADGEFVFQLRPDRDYVLLAKTERRFAGEMTDFAWFLPVDPEALQSRLLLSNHNLISEESPKDIFETQGLARSPES